MPRPPLYPLHPHVIESELSNLIDTGRHHDGKSAVIPKPRYFRNFRFHSCATYRSPETVRDRRTKFYMRCVIHDEIFHTNMRVIFSTSQIIPKSICRFCQRAAGVGPNFVTLGEIAQQMATDTAFDWRLDTSRLKSEDQRAQRILRRSDVLPLICKRKKWNSAKPCDGVVAHAVNNILTTLRGRSKHLVCQGECDSKNKGKASRMSLEDLESRIAAVRAGAWRLSKPSDYRKISEGQWFTHIPCGNEVFRVPHQILGYQTVEWNGAGRGERDDCPYCSAWSVLSCVRKSVKHFKKWTRCVTANRVRYLGATFPRSNNQRLKFQCSCGNPFEETLENLVRNQHHGCGDCKIGALRAKRAWKVDDAKAIVERRGYFLLDDPRSYTKAAALVCADGRPSQYKNILELVRALPMHSYGVGPVMPDRAACSAKDRNVGKRRSQRLFHVNDAAFSELTREVCYWAGLLAADGCMSGRLEVILELQARDELVIQNLMQYLQFTGHCGYRTVKTVGGRGIYCSLRFTSAQVRSDLQNHFGIGPRKTYTLPRPNLPDEGLERAYMVGMIEGDGHVGKRNRGLVVHFVSGSYDVFEWFRDRANAITGTSPSVYTIQKDSVPVHNVTYQGGAGMRLLDSLKEAYQGTMSRKWEI